MSHLSIEALAQLRAALVVRRDAKAVAALRRLELDDYGLCLRCGDELGLVMLEADPGRGFCEACEAAQRVERDRSRFGICGIKAT